MATFTIDCSYFVGQNVIMVYKKEALLYWFDILSQFYDAHFQ